jgi:O-antigen/teichoic acid export membrane protein
MDKLTRLLSKWLGVDLVSKTTQENTGRTLLFGAGGSFFVNASSRALLFCIHVFLVRYLGKDNYGIYVLVLGWVNILYVLVNLGYDSSAIRFIPEYNGRGEGSLAKGFIRRSIRLVFLQSLAVVVLGAVVLIILGDENRSDLYLTLWAGLILIPVKALIQLLTAILRGFKVVISSLILSNIINPLLTAAGILILLYALGREVSAGAGMLINVAASATVLVLCWLLLRKALPLQVKESPQETNSKLWRNVSLPLVLVSCSQLILARTDFLMVGALAGTYEAGLYNVAFQCALLVSFGLTSANLIIAPLIAQLYSQGRHEQLQRMIKAASRGISVYAATVFVIIVVFGKPILGLFDKDFISGYDVLVILCLGQLMVSFTGPVGFLMTMTGHHHEALWVISASALLNIILNAMLIWFMGVIGAALATVIVVCLRSLVFSVMVRKQLDLNTSAFSSR